MKLFALTLFLSLIGNLVFAQQFSGRLANLNSKELEIISYHNPGYYKRDTVYADADGNFTAKLNLTGAGYIYLRGSNFRNEEIYLYPGADLNLHADAASSESFWNTQQYTGSAAVYNNFRADFERNPRKNKLGWSRATYDLAPTAFISTIDQFFIFRDSMKRVYFEKLPKSKLLQDFLVTDSVQSTYFKGAVWGSYYGIHEDEQFYQSYLAMLNVQFDDPRFLASQHYRWYFSTLIRRKYDQLKATTGKPQPWYTYFEQAPELINKNLKEALRPIVAASLLENIIDNYKEVPDSLLRKLDASLALIFPLVKNNALIGRTQQAIAQIKLFRNTIQDGTVALPINMINSSGKAFTLADFKGKLIYIDVWASWCVPCIGEFPNGRKLEEAYKEDKRLVFISLSVDDSKSDWLDKGMKHKPVGLQFLSPGGFKSQFTKDYQLSAIPHYILIDEHGKFVSYSAPRPGSAEIRPMLDHALSLMQK